MVPLPRHSFSNHHLSSSQQDQFDFLHRYTNQGILLDLLLGSILVNRENKRMKDPQKNTLLSRLILFGLNCECI